MTSRQERFWNAINAILQKIKGRPFDIPEIQSSLAELAEVEARICKFRFVQSWEKPGSESKRIKALREELRVHYMLRISRRGRSLLSGILTRQDLQVPHYSASNKDLLIAARRIAKHYRAYAKVFVGVGFPKDLPKRFDAAIKELATWSANTDTAMNRRSFATGSLPAELKKAREIIDSIDASVRSELAHDTIAVHCWRKAKRVPGRVGRPKKPRKPPESTDGSN